MAKTYDFWLGYNLQKFEAILNLSHAVMKYFWLAASLKMSKKWASGDLRGQILCQFTFFCPRMLS
jgi:hypothetical protein